MGKQGKKRWEPILIVEAYKLARLGVGDPEIIVQLDVTKPSFYRWMKEHPELRKALDMAREELKQGETFPTFVYSRLTPELKKVWDRIESLEEEEIEKGGGDHKRRSYSAVRKIEAILVDHGKRVRQQLFLYALCCNGFSPSLALQKVNVSKKELNQWIEGDVEFAELVQEIEWHKANFFEHSLTMLVAQGVPAAVIFANKTYNSERGYGSRSQVDVTVSGSVLHGVMDLDEIAPFLSESAISEIMNALREKEKRENVRVLSPEQRIAKQISCTVDATQGE